MPDAAAAPVAVDSPDPDAATHAGLHWLVVANPVAGRAGPESRAWQRIVQALREAGIPCDIEWTRARGDGARIAAEAQSRGQYRFLVAGGDGSLHDVVNGLLRTRTPGVGTQLQTPVPVVVPLPLGTGNDWSRSLQLPRDPAALAALIAHGPTVPHDVGRIDFLDRNGAATGETCWFINVAGAGFDAYVIERMPARTPSRLAYLYGALRELARYRPPLFRIGLEGAAGDATEASTPSGRKLLAFIANGRYCGNGMHVAPHAQLDDGRFDVVTIDALGFWEALPRLARLYTGGLLRDRAVRHTLASSVRIDAEPGAGIEADGQFVGHAPARFTVVRGRLQTVRGR